MKAAMNSSTVFADVDIRRSLPRLVSGLHIPGLHLVPGSGQRRPVRTREELQTSTLNGAPDRQGRIPSGMAGRAAQNATALRRGGSDREHRTPRQNDDLLPARDQRRHVSARFASQTIASADHVDLNVRPPAPHPVITRTWSDVRAFWVRWVRSILSGPPELVRSTSPASGLDVVASLSTRGPPRPL